MRRSWTFRWPDNQISVIPVAIFTLKLQERQLKRRSASTVRAGMSGTLWRLLASLDAAGRHTYSRIHYISILLRHRTTVDV